MVVVSGRRILWVAAERMSKKLEKLVRLHGRIAIVHCAYLCCFRDFHALHVSTTTWGSVLHLLSSLFAMLAQNAQGLPRAASTGYWLGGEIWAELASVDGAMLWSWTWIGHTFFGGDMWAFSLYVRHMQILLSMSLPALQIAKRCRRHFLGCGVLHVFICLDSHCCLDSHWSRRLGLQQFFIFIYWITCSSEGWASESFGLPARCFKAYFKASEGI